MFSKAQIVKTVSTVSFLFLTSIFAQSRPFPQGSDNDGWIKPANKT
jgi:hypothetical protein